MTHQHGHSSHSHGNGITLEPEQHDILERGLKRLLEITAGMDFKELNSEKYPLPLQKAVYKQPPTPQQVRQDIESRLNSDPVSVLEPALVLLEMYECNQPDILEFVEEDMPFLSTCFNSKRCNGWISIMGECQREPIESLINKQWSFRFFSGPQRPTGIYALLNKLARYAFVYGRIAAGDCHSLAHFVEDHTPGLLVCQGKMTDLEFTLSLMAMKMGVPAIIEGDYPFPLGRTVRIDNPEELPEAVVGFANIRKLLQIGELPPLPDYLDSENAKEKIEPTEVWGNSNESFYILTKGKVEQSGVKVTGVPQGSMGVIITIDAEPMDCFDQKHIERIACNRIAFIKGVGLEFKLGKLTIKIAEKGKFEPSRLGETMSATIRNTFPKLKNISVEIIFDQGRLRELSPEIQNQHKGREESIAAATDENMPTFYGCLGCSPFAPDHVCILTPERSPQCGRAFEEIKCGALYQFDDMSNIHHRNLHKNINSFQVVEKGRCIDPVLGEWEGVNEHAVKLTDGRTSRITLHSLGDNPTTGCGCFRIILFKTDSPKEGVGIMERGFDGAAPDGRRWEDLHYALAGKQTSGISGCGPHYLKSPKFLQAEGGWQSIVWVTPKIAEICKDLLNSEIMIGEA